MGYDQRFAPFGELAVVRTCLLLALFSGFLPASLCAQLKVERRADGVLFFSNNPDRARTSKDIRAQALRSEQEAPGVVRGRSAAPAELRGRIAHWAGLRRLDPRLVEAVIRVESAFNTGARSSKGAMGLMQLMPATARDLGVSDAYDPDQNLRGGTAYLRRMIDRFDGDLRLALAGYNAGPGAVEKYRGVPPYRETTAYVDRVLSMYGSATR